jgi:acetolactate synthase-1/2/3 large subunit
VVPEDAEVAMGFEPTRTQLGHLQALLDEADLVLVLGAKLSHNATAGFNLKLAEETLVQVDASEEVLEANYPASLAVRGDVPGLLRALAEADLSASAWTDEELAEWRSRLRTPDGMPGAFEPALPEGVESWDAFFRALQDAMGPDAVVATDSGQHQFLARRYVEVRSPRGLLIPSDFQSMGFGIPAAIGAAVAAPERRVVAVVGDGGFLMSAPELSVAAREGIRVTVVVVNDGYYGLIRAQQVSSYGHVHGTRLPGVDLEALSWSLGARYERVGSPPGGPSGEAPGADPASALRRAAEHDGVTVLDLPVSDSSAFAAHQVRAKVREGVHSVAGPAVQGLKGLIRRLKG